MGTYIYILVEERLKSSPWIPGNLYTCGRRVEKQSLNPRKLNIYLWKKAWKVVPESQRTYITYLVEEGLKSSPWVQLREWKTLMIDSLLLHIAQVVGVPPGWNASPKQVSPAPPPQIYVRVYAICQRGSILPSGERYCSCKRGNCDGVLLKTI